MESCNQKFTNFKRYVSENTQNIDLSTSMRFIFMSLSLEQFLTIIATDDDTSQDITSNTTAMTNKIFGIIGITRDSFGFIQLKKFELYISYFITVSRVNTD